MQRIVFCEFLFDEIRDRQRERVRENLLSNRKTSSRVCFAELKIVKFSQRVEKRTVPHKNIYIYISNLSFPWNLGHQLLLPLTPELSESELFLHPFVLFNYSLHSRAIIPPIHETVLNSTRKRTWFVSRGGKRGKKQKRR